MTNFLSCDWGTSSFRLRLIETQTLTIIAEQNTTQGIAETFQKWKDSARDESDRFAFFLDIISQHIKVIEERIGEGLSAVTLIISGMASSTIGMVDIAYKSVPFLANGSDLEKLVIEPSENTMRRVVIISGVRTEDDVMRGEETKLAGVADVSETKDHLYIFPGTHPKHVYVKNKVATAFKTYMTGEFFELLSTKSVLAVSVRKNENFETAGNFKCYARGVSDSTSSNILHNAFLVRTNQVFEKFTMEENYYYLSGLLIGTELGALASEDQNITIVANRSLGDQYKAALDILQMPKGGFAISIVDADKALIKGQFEVYRKVSVG